ncbi:hypothetical protein PFISCL1PPCAC_9301, partial [Pristionchus fissidentatus]
RLFEWSTLFYPLEFNLKHFPSSHYSRFSLFIILHCLQQDSAPRRSLAAAPPDLDPEESYRRGKASRKPSKRQTLRPAQAEMTGARFRHLIHPTWDSVGPCLSR